MKAPIALSRVFWLCAVLAGTSFVLAAGSDSSPKAISLFNGRSLEGWSHVLADMNVPKDKVWSVRDGMLVCTGAPIGVLYSEKDYTDFHLVVEYRWAPGAKPGNSGIMSRMSPGTGALPRTAEVQLQHGNAGDVIGLQGFAISGPQPRWFERDSAVAGKVSGVKRARGAEKPAGEWNRVEIDARGGRYVVQMNGEVVNEVTGVELKAGRIGLQSEGGEIHFRNVVLTAR